MKFVKRVPISEGQLYYEAPEGNYKYFDIIVQGTNGAVPATLDDIGRILFSLNNSPLFDDIDFEFLSQLANLKGGVVTFTSVGAGELTAFFRIPCGEFGDITNSYLINKKDVLSFRLNFPALSALVGITGNIAIFAVEGEGVQNYLFLLSQSQVVASGAGRIGDVHRLPNVANIYVKNNALANDALIKKDGKIIADATLTQLLLESNFNNQVETASTLIEIACNPSRTLEENAGNEIEFSYNFTALATLEQYFQSIVLTQEKASQSVVINNQKLAQKIANNVIKTEPKILPVGNTKGGTVSGGGSPAMPPTGGMMGNVKLISPDIDGI